MIVYALDKENVLETGVKDNKMIVQIKEMTHIVLQVGKKRIVKEIDVTAMEWESVSKINVIIGHLK